MISVFNNETTLPALQYETIITFFSFTLGVFNKFNSISQVKYFILICQNNLFKTPSLPFPRLIKSLNELRTHLRLSLDEKDFGEATMTNLEQLVVEGGEEECEKMKAAFEVFN